MLRSQPVEVLTVFLLAASTLQAQAVPACPVPAVDTSSWFRVRVHAPRVEFTLPPGFVRTHYDISVGQLPPHQEWHRDPFLSFHIEESTGPDSLMEATPRRPPGAEDYSECTEHVNGVRAAIQSLRGSGTIFDQGKQWKSFDVYATIEERPGLYIRVSAHAASRTDQEELLMVVRTVRLW